MSDRGYSRFWNLNLESVQALSFLFFFFFLYAPNKPALPEKLRMA